MGGLPYSTYASICFGGSLFGMVNPLCILLLMTGLGSDYVVWRKSVCIDVTRPIATPDELGSGLAMLTGVLCSLISALDSVITCHLTYGSVLGHARFSIIHAPEMSRSKHLV